MIDHCETLTSGQSGRVTDTAGLIEYAERSRTHGWSLRSALVRYAQPQPARAGAVLELVRRTDGALKPIIRLVEREPQLVQIASDGDDRHLGELSDEERTAVQLLRVALRLDQLGEVLAGWAADRSDNRPDDEVDEIAHEVFAMLRDLGVERETRPPRRA